ncbi:hypothetical protein NQZ68_031708 [Dissostichus eleginoides]|nr:hypothetical protein NQZ68_031708 [Dissostichus eleginoides]
MECKEDQIWKEKWWSVDPGSMAEIQSRREAVELAEVPDRSSVPGWADPPEDGTVQWAKYRRNVDQLTGGRDVLGCDRPMLDARIMLAR